MGRGGGEGGGVSLLIVSQGDPRTKLMKGPSNVVHCLLATASSLL